MNQAWLITKVDIENHKVFDTFVAILDSNIPSEEIRKITEDLYHSLVIQTGSSFDHKRESAKCRILNDGTLHTGSIYCGHNPSFYARRVYDIVITTNSNQSYILQWREAHILMKDSKPEIEFWEDFSVTMPLIHNSNSNNESPVFL